MWDGEKVLRKDKTSCEKDWRLERERHIQKKKNSSLWLEASVHDAGEEESKT